MNRLPLILGLILAAQLLLAATLYRAGAPEVRDATPLLANWEAVDKVQISDGEGKATLTRSADGWVVQELDGLPADGDRVTGALDALGAITLGFPLTTTASAHDRFEVAEDDPQRRLELYAGDEPRGAILLGSSPGFRQVHLRRAGEDAVYAVQLNAFDFPADPQQWLDKQLLALDSPTRIETADYVLELEGERWALASAAAVDQEQAQALAAAFGSLRVNGTGEPLSGDEIGETEVTVTGGGDTYTYRFLSDGEQYRIARSDREGVFRVSQYEYDRIVGVGLDDLAAGERPEPE